MCAKKRYYIIYKKKLQKKKRNTIVCLLLFTYNTKIVIILYSMRVKIKGNKRKRCEQDAMHEKNKIIIKIIIGKSWQTYIHYTYRHGTSWYRNKIKRKILFALLRFLMRDGKKYMYVYSENFIPRSFEEQSNYN